MAGYDAPVELRELEKMLNNFTYGNGFDISTVFDDWLLFIINNFNTKPQPNPSWKYTKDQNMVFHNMMCEWIRVMERFVERKGWYDAFGELYEACVAGKGRRSNSGQFFTPPHICDLMVHVNCGDRKMVKKNVGDPTCGSGRLLLSFNSMCPGNYMCAEDLDRTCCMMTVANFIIHGVVGEVVWHNSLDPASWSGGWRVNEQLNTLFSPLRGIPHMREIEQSESRVIQIWESRRVEVAQSRAEVKELPPIIKEKSVIVEKGRLQLSLWD